MIRQLILIMTVVASIAHSTRGSPHHHDDEDRRILRLLKEARKQRRYEELSGLGSSQNAQFQYPISSGFGSGSNSGGSSGGSNGGGNGGSPPTPILTPDRLRPSSSTGTVRSSISGVIPSAGGPSSNYRPVLPNFPSGSQVVGQLPQYPIEQVNRGVNTILAGVRSLDLGQILRGAFIFPRNENVRSVANNVIDSIFGNARQPSGGARL